MNTQNSEDAKIIRGEIVIAIEILVADRGRLLNKDALKKCPSCSKEGKMWFSRSNNRSGKAELHLRCPHCGYQWVLRFIHPFPKPFIDTDL